MSEPPPFLPKQEHSSFLSNLEEGKGEFTLSSSDTFFFDQEAKDLPVISESDPIPLSKKIFSGLISTIINIILLIFLALLFFQGRIHPVSVDAIFSDREGDQLDIETLDEGNIDPNPAETYILPEPDVGDLSDFVAPENLEVDLNPESLQTVSEASRVDITNLFEGRTDPGTKNDLLSKYGGNRKTSDAVRLGLIWLSKQQQKEGNWSLSGPFRNGVPEGSDNRAAATGLALLAFQGDGNTRYDGEYQKAVRKGWKWLLNQQDEIGNGSFFSEGLANGMFYTQAICTIAICELVAMERKEGKGEDLAGNAQSAVDYLVERQNKMLGGWRYSVNQREERKAAGKNRAKRVVIEESTDSDLSVTGWCLMALMSAKVAGINVPDETLSGIEHFLDQVVKDGGTRYSYLPQDQATPSMTATGFLCREYLGCSRRNPLLLQGAEFLTSPENLVSYPMNEKNRFESMTNVYGWYSTSMMLKHLGANNPFWRKWNTKLSEEIPKHQEQAGSEEAGSWDSTIDSYGFGGGRLYVTVLSILCMEVYYRHLSLYE